MPHIYCIKVKVSILAKSALWKPKSTPSSEIGSNSEFLRPKVHRAPRVLGVKIGERKFRLQKVGLEYCDLTHIYIYIIQDDRID